MPLADPSASSGVGALPSVLGDFVVAWGPKTAQWVHALEGFTPHEASGESAHAATRGAVQAGLATNGARWLAVADLIEGDLEKGVGALADGMPPQGGWRGRFVQAVWQTGTSGDRRLAAVTDHFSTLPLYTLSRDDVFVVATDMRVLARSPWCKREIDLESVYHYLNFACIPAPATIFRDVRRLLPSTRVRRSHGGAPTLDRYYVPEYPEDLRGSDSKLAGELRERIVATVEAYGLAAPGGWGCFLSGGTDSSSVVSILARQAGSGRVKSFSIGFAEAGYDELDYARLAATACHANPSFAKVSREDALGLVQRTIEAYDQPFGNASAIPTLACADLARQNGAEVLLAGDGGDEIFGGNQRYVKDKVMETWFALPKPVTAVGRAVGDAVGGSSIHFLNRVENFFERASLPNPDRFYTDDSFASDHYDELLSAEFRREVPQNASLDAMRTIYQVGRTGGPLHRIMRLDLLMAIAQNDIPKVHGATRSAGVTTRFPMLDPELVRYTCRLPERQKVRGLGKRFLFKRAMTGILPDATLRKKKQGFGLPISVWLRSDAAFQATVRETLFDGRSSARGWWQPAFVEGLLEEHIRGSWDHADSIFRLYILERWLRRYVDAA
jgi:asparagine synthase (glutamine-hydrolysing)